MAKKPFQYDRDAEEPWIPNTPRESLADRARKPAEAKALAERLVAMPAADRAGLELDDSLVAALAELERIHPKKRAARRRKLAHIASLVDAHDPDVVQSVLDAVEAGVSEREAAIEGLVRWRERLIADGAALTDFLTAYPASDRQRVRQLATAARKALGTPTEQKAARALLQAMKVGNLG